MDVLRFDGLTRAYGAREIFGGLAGVIRDGQTIGLVGPNGAGKSSLVRILAGLETPDGGSLVRARDVRLGYLSQAANADDGGTLRMLLAQAFERFHAAEAHLRALEEALSTTEDPDALDKALHAYGEAREAFDRHGGDAIERRMRSMLVAFDFDEDDLDRPIASFSGGQRTRASLARLLLEEPDYLILDEPTNHLDLETVRWLEEFLIGDHRATLVVSHDRFFLDRVANEIWELDGGTLSTYVVPRGRGYEAYLVEKAERLALAQRKYEAFKEEEKRRKDVVAELRTHGSHNYSHVRSREKQLAKMERVEAPKSSQASISVKLDAARRATTGLALDVKGLSKSFGEPLFAGLSFQIARGERVALVGPNGAGKSTLLEILAGRTAADAGSVKVLEGVKTAFFAQDSSDDLAPELSAVDAVRDGPNVTDQAARALLGRLGLGGDAAEKPVGAFSGGERRRIMLARLMARSADLLFLDEPTNDLDIPSREALEAVLVTYGGAMIVVSHDRYLLRRLAERVLHLHDGGATFVQGGYERFEELVRTGATRDPAAATNGTKNAKGASERDGKNGKPVNDRADKSSGSNGNGRSSGSNGNAKPKDAKRAKALASAEREVARLDEERARLEGEFLDPHVYDDRERVAQLERELAAVRAAADAALERWEALSEEPALA